MVSGYPTSMNLLQVDGLSTNPRDLGHHKRLVNGTPGFWGVTAIVDYVLEKNLSYFKI